MSAMLITYRLNSSLCISATSDLLDSEYCAQKTGTKMVQVHIRVLGGEVVLARTRYGEADIGHEVDQAGGVCDGADRNLVEDPGLDFHKCLR